MLHRLAAVLFLFCCVAPAAWAQPAILNGTVRDAESGETLIQATILAEGLGVGTATNAQGFYALGGIAPGEVTLVASFVGGFIYLAASMPRGPRDPGDDGAVV